MTYNQALDRIRQHLPRTAEAIADRGGFLLAEDLPKLISIDRLILVLVRCGNGRFLCPAQDVEHFVAIVTKEGTDYVRDVSLPT